MSATAILSRGRMRTLGLAAKRSRQNPDGFADLAVTAELLIKEEAEATEQLAFALSEFKEEVRQHKGSYVSSRKDLKKAFRAARESFSFVSDLALHVQNNKSIVRNASLHQTTFIRLKQLQDDFYEMLADMDDEKLHQRISEAFKASPKGTGEPADWRSLVFDEEP